MGPADIEALRAEIRALLEAEPSLTVERLAQEIAVPMGTLTVWIGGRYAGREDLVGQRVREGLKLRAERQQLRAVAPAEVQFVETPGALEFLEVFTLAQHLPDMAVVVGAPGIGKSMAAQHYAATTPAVYRIIASPAVIGPRAVLDEVARAMGLLPQGALHNLQNDIIRRLRHTGALLIVDEAQELQPAALNQLRALHDQAGVGIALLGNETVMSRVDGGGRPEFAQLSRRVGRRLLRKGLRAGDAAAVLDAAEIEDAEMRRLLMAVAKRPGALGVMRKVLTLARIAASRAGEELSARHIELADASLARPREAA
jgi:DNA transposition AAA+ family ATPase